jgi:long-chain fatty acid transport protein
MRWSASKLRKFCLGIGVVVLASVAGSALATEGYFQHGYGARHKALAGAGVGDGQDATTIALNPAALWRAPNEFSIAVSGFMPYRFLEGNNIPGFTPSALVDSESNFFLIPNMAWSYKLAPGSFIDVVGISVYGNGGMNTDYPAVTGGAFCPLPGAGVFCGFDRTGVNLQQAFISLAASKRFGTLSVGIAPIIARQQFEANGITAFGVTGNVTDVSWGYGIRAGIEWEVAPGIRFGLAGNSRVYMERFKKYSNLFAEQGDFDIPASLQAGIAIDVSKNLTIMADYKHIWYGSIKSIANPSANALFAPFGADNGPGFGWRDIDIFKLGIEWRATHDLTLRAGYAYNTNPIRSDDVMFNILAPGVVQHHLTGGFEYRLNPKWSIEGAFMYAPEITVNGTELAGFGNPLHTIEIGMHQFDVTLGVKYKWGTPDEPLK